MVTLVGEERVGGGGGSEEEKERKRRERMEREGRKGIVVDGLRYRV